MIAKNINMYKETIRRRASRVEKRVLEGNPRASEQATQGTPNFKSKGFQGNQARQHHGESQTVAENATTRMKGVQQTDPPKSPGTPVIHAV